MMGTCKDCRFFKRFEWERLGECSRWLMGYDVSQDAVKDNEVHVEDDEGWGAEMGPDFGCVLYEPKSG